MEVEALEPDADQTNSAAAPVSLGKGEASAISHCQQVVEWQCT